MVIFDYGDSGNPSRFSKQDQRIACVMQNVDEHYHVETVVRVGDCESVEEAYRYFGGWPHEDVNTFDPCVWHFAGNDLCDGTVAATDVENAAVRGDQRGEMTCENANSATKDQFVMQDGDRFCQ
jgi:hypothetical protein